MQHSQSNIKLNFIKIYLNKFIYNLFLHATQQYLHL